MGISLYSYQARHTFPFLGSWVFVLDYVNLLLSLHLSQVPAFFFFLTPPTPPFKSNISIAIKEIWWETQRLNKALGLINIDSILKWWKND